MASLSDRLEPISRNKTFPKRVLVSVYHSNRDANINWHQRVRLGDRPDCGTCRRILEFGAGKSAECSEHNRMFCDFLERIILKAMQIVEACLESFGGKQRLC